MSEMFISVIGIFFIFFMTCAGSSTVFFKRKNSESLTQHLFLGFAGGVMLAASFFSLIIPSFTYSSMLKISHVIPATGGILLGAIFILVFDIIISKQKDNSVSYKDKKLFMAMTVHNIPEGLSVGFTFGLALANVENVTVFSGLIFALGIGIQNFPEGAALALPLEEELHNKKKAFFLSCLSGFVEPIFGFLGLYLSTRVLFLMPWSLCFGAGSMIYVIIDELIVNSSKSKEKRLTNLAFIFGFLIMMTLDLCL